MGTEKSINAKTLEQAQTVLNKIPVLLQSETDIVSYGFFYLLADNSCPQVDILQSSQELDNATNTTDPQILRSYSKHKLYTTKLPSGTSRIFYKFALPDEPDESEFFFTALLNSFTPENQAYTSGVLTLASQMLCDPDTSIFQTKLVKNFHTFTASVNHEIRNQLNGLVGVTELLLSTPLDTVQQNYMQTLKHSTESVMQLHNDMLDQSRIRLGRFTIRPQEFNLYRLLEEINIIYGHKAALKKIEMWVNYPNDMPHTFSGDPTRIKQVLINLVNNALKYTIKGSISITSYTTPNQQTAIRVSDTGPGIKDSELNHIFDNFTQINPDSLASIDGVGLGLSISKQLVELMGGTITVSSVPGHGTDFLITLGLIPCKIQPPQPQYPALKNKKILVCSKNTSFAQSIAENLAGHGLKTLYCTYTQDPAQLITAALQDKQPFDIFIADQPDSSLLNSITIPCISLDSIRQNTHNVNSVTKPVRAEMLMSTLEKIVTQDTPPCFSAEKNVKTNKAQNDLLSHCFEKMKPRILVVDDDPVNRLVTTQMLEKINCHPQQAPSGQQAIEIMRKNIFDMILMDCYMPDMSGFEATRQIRTDKLTSSQTPIIAFTAHNVEEYQWKQCGMTKCITKPLRFKDIYNTVLELIQPSTPVINEKEACEMFGGDAKLLREVIEIFVKETPAILKQLTEALSQNNIQASILFSHRLKGSARNIKAKDFEAAALKAEQSARDNNLEETRKIVPAIEREFMRIFWIYKTRQVLESVPQTQC